MPFDRADRADDFAFFKAQNWPKIGPENPFFPKSGNKEFPVGAISDPTKVVREEVILTEVQHLT